ncbi:MAG TPA: 30S ribosomal protein S5 [Armatimonadota bacterium]|jgi:small subunit ribosomal protein S5
MAYNNRPNPRDRDRQDDSGLEERIIRTNKVQKTHKGGRTLSWSVLIVVGDKNGQVGVGLGKALSIPDAIRKGVETAKKSLMTVPMVGTTIPHDIVVDFGASRVLLKPASPGTGVVAGGAVRAILEAAGVKDVLAKSLGSNNPVNNAWATIKALKALQTVDSVCKRRGVGLDRLSVRPEVRAAAEAAGVGNVSA